MTETLHASAHDRQFPDPIPGIINFGTVNLFAGASGAGKTIMLADWFARMRDGRSIWGHKTQAPTAFYVLAADRGWRDYEAAFTNASFGDVPHYCLAEDDEVDFRDWARDKVNAFQRLDYCLGKLLPIPGSLVSIDPVAPIFIHGDQNRASNVALSIHHLRRVARRHQITLMCMANVAKLKLEEDFKRPQDRISGSGAFLAYSDTQIFLAQGNELTDPHTVGWAPRRSAPETFSCRFNVETKLFEPNQEPVAQGKTVATDRPTQILLLMPEGEMVETATVYERVQELFGIHTSVFYGDLKTLQSRGLLSYPRRGYIMRVKVS